MENRLGLAIVRSLLLFCSFNICQASSGVASKTLSEDKSAENFLFKYFGLAPSLKAFPTGVQHVICAHLIEDFLVPFVLEEPIAQYSSDKHEFISIRSLEFSPDDSHLALITSSNIRIGPLTLDGTARNQCLSTFESQLPLGVWVKVRLNRDFTKMAIIHHEDEKEATLSELILTNYKVTGEEQVIGTIKKLLQDETMYVPEVYEAVDGHEWRKPRNRVASCSTGNSSIPAMFYIASGDLIIATTYRKIFLLGQDGSLKQFEDPLQKFDPHERVYCRNGKNLEHRWAGECRVALHPLSSKMAFQSNCDLTIGNYEIGEFKSLLEQNPHGPWLKAISSTGQWIVLLAMNRNVDVIDTRTHAKSRLTVPYGINDAAFLLDGKFLIIHQSGGQKSWIYYTPSLKLVGWINHRCGMEPHLASVEFKSCSFTATSSPTGKYIALVTELPLSDNKATHALRIWETDQSWLNLEDLYRGHITLEQALFIIFLRKLACEKKSLASVAQETGISRDELVSYLQQVLTSFTIDQTALRLYLRYAIMKIPK